MQYILLAERVDMHSKTTQGKSRASYAFNLIKMAPFQHNTIRMALHKLMKVFFTI